MCGRMDVKDGGFYGIVFKGGVETMGVVFQVGIEFVDSVSFKEVKIEPV